MGRRDDEERFSRRGQVTLFIIISLLIVSVILIYFLWIKPDYIAPSGSIGIERCMEKAVEEEIQKLANRAGYIEPPLSHMYMGDSVGYLCYTNLYYKPCINNNPFIKDNFEQQLTTAAKGAVYECYENSLKELQRKGYEISGEDKEFSISLDPGQVVIELSAPVTISRESSSRFTKFKSTVNSALYDLLMIATAIVQQETKYGDSDTDTLMLFYPDISIDKIKRDDGTNVYVITDKTSKLKYQFATRSFAWPAGYGSDTGLVMK